MTLKRKAELQRKLSMAAVPTPPEGLAQRIKDAIPESLKDEKPERPRLSRSLAFSMRIAASLVLLITSVALSLHLLSRGEGPQASKSAASDSAAARSVSPQFADTAEVIVSLSDEVKPERQAALGATAAAPIEVEASSRDRRADAPANTEKRSTPANESDAGKKEKKDQEREESGVAQVADGKLNRTQSVDQVTTAGAREPAAAAPAPSAPRSSAAPYAVQAETLRVAKSVHETQPSDPDTVFGFSVDPNEFDRLVALIESGSRPDPVDVAAIVNHFAGRAVPATPGVKLEVEGSPQPFADDRAVVRFSIDASGKSGERVATDAEVEVVLNRSVVTRHRLVGRGQELKATEGTLIAGASATGLVELQMKRGVSVRHEIATVRLNYRETATGKRRTITKTVRAGDLQKEWGTTTRRHRLATLAALWGESLHGGTAAIGLARAAEALSAQDPSDSRARDLAAAASASYRLRSSGPTGSGR
ncbi:MAG: hypothetical protein JJE51_07950 [Thermoanaerobaculia bacterium]|nr:hypothetical protein [Thermoanaerobaculia bacterium]